MEHLQSPEEFNHNDKRTVGFHFCGIYSSLLVCELCCVPKQHRISEMAWINVRLSFYG